MQIKDHEMAGNSLLAWHMQEELVQAHVTKKDAVQARNNAGRTFELCKRERKASTAHKVGPVLHHNSLALDHAQGSQNMHIMFTVTVLS